MFADTTECGDTVIFNDIYQFEKNLVPFSVSDGIIYVPKFPVADIGSLVSSEATKIPNNNSSVLNFFMLWVIIYVCARYILSHQNLKVYVCPLIIYSKL